MIRLIVLLCLAVLPAVANAQEPPKSDPTTVLELRLLEAERQAIEQYSSRLQAEARAIQAEFPAVQQRLDAKKADLRDKLGKAAEKAGVKVDEYELDLATGLWRKRGGAR